MVGDDTVANVSISKHRSPTNIIAIVLLEVYGGISAHESQGCQGFLLDINIVVVYLLIT